MPNNTEVTVHLNAGWPRALATMQGPGKRWWVSAYVTSAAEHAPVEAGDHVLIRGEIRDFEHGSSNIDAIEHLLAKGVEIRRSPDLHAKMYVQEVDGGLALAWIGSANLTYPGRSDGRWKANYEVMAGPLELTRAQMKELVRLWSGAAVVDHRYLRSVRLALQERLIVDVSRFGDVLVAYIDLRLQSGTFSIPPTWFVDWPGWEGVATSVRFLTEETPFIRDWQVARRTIMDGFARWFGERTGERGEFVMEAADFAPANAALAEARRLVGRISPLGESEMLDKALTGFLGRAMVVVQTQAKSRRLRQDEAAIEKQLAEAFRRYVASASSRMAYTILAPVSPPEGEILAAVRRLKLRPRRLFVPDAESAADAFLTEIRAVLQ